MIEPTLGFGLFVRLLGLVYAFQFATTAHQLPALIGSCGAQPVRNLLYEFRRDFGVIRGVLRYPTLFWISSSDAMIRVLPWLGVASGLLIASGAAGGWNPVIFLACWLIMLSLMNSGSSTFLFFPWDLLLLECGLLSIFLPHPTGPMQLELVTAPGFLVHLAFVLLAFRLMLGMGLAKFWWGRKEATHRDRSYIHHLLEWQPLATAHAVWARSLPMFVHRLAYRGLLVVEIILPWLIFAGSWGRATLAIPMMLLQIGIALTGNYGTFNILTLLLGIPLLSTMPAWTLPPPELDSLVLATLVALPLPVFLFLNTWTNGNWMFQPSFLPLPSLVRRYLGLLAPLYRPLAPYRLFSAYGVFTGVASIPKSVHTIQVSPDGVRWFDVVPRWQTCRPEARPRWFAPYHPRWDHFIFYYKSSPTSIPPESLAPWNPYGFRDIGLVDRIIEHLYRGNPLIESIFLEVPIRSPSFIRVAGMQYRLNTASERRRTGHYWSRSLLSASEVYARIDLEHDVGRPVRIEDLRTTSISMVEGRMCFVNTSSESEPVPCVRHPVSVRDPRTAFLEAFSSRKESPREYPPPDRNPR